MPAEMESASDTARPPLRRDAQRNRDALLAAARDIFSARGLDAPLEQVARRAGMAIGTLYRHFPTRVELLQAIFVHKLRLWHEAAERAAAAEDAWEGFRLYLETTCELLADDRGLGDLASVRLPESAGLDEVQRRIAQLATHIVERAQRQGTLRTDITPEDLAYVVWSHTRIAHATHGIAPDNWRRHLYLMLDAFRADRAHLLPEPPLTGDQLHRSMLRLGGADMCPGEAQEQ
ncbi:TetR/AcrR family transcriptional regulator [Streptomyces phyllanthi]|uniref:TetR/AcrR family transcriptional regulator n=1 Tax=Streptomyces phyllanthi TaxID=1803180 RepID=A0A5N8VTX8_9ACTN|nr:TetR/AcrR family transcriptional regulator [Streptomyces phyllanthi]MPY38439.1 TetR/AcrR family transcriptional regulator [Streptomyces phyllanthi]